MNQKF